MNEENRTSIADADRRSIAAFIERVWSEDGLADRTLEAYRRDLQGLARWLARAAAASRGRVARTSPPITAPAGGGAKLARRQSAFRRFYGIWRADEARREDPTLLMQRPRMPRGLPKALAEREIEALIVAPDTGTPLGLRDRAMLELMYSSGLRVSELVDLPLAGLNPRQGVLRVTGKGGKDRLVPVGEEAIAHMETYLREARPLLAKGRQPPALFLCRRGAAMSRQMFWTLVKRYAKQVGIPAKPRVAPCAAPFVCHPPAQPRRRPSRAADAAGPQRAQHHPDLHPGREGRPQAPSRAASPARLNRGVAQSGRNR